MTIFTCADTFEGILCGVYDAWTSRLGHENVCLELADTGNLRLFAEYRQVEEDPKKAAKVIEAIRKKAGQEVYERVYRASLSCEEQKADRIYRFLIYALYIGPEVVNMLQIPAVYELFRMNRFVANEALHMIEFIRFSRTDGGILFGTVEPRNDVVALMAPHFADRMNAEDWVIYDERRRRAVIHQAMGEWIEADLSDDSFRQRLMDSSDQEEFENLWKTYHKHIAIKERTNPRCQMSHLPLRFRPHMTEFQERRAHSGGRAPD